MKLAWLCALGLLSLGLYSFNHSSAPRKAAALLGGLEGEDSPPADFAHDGLGLNVEPKANLPRLVLDDLTVSAVNETVTATLRLADEVEDREGWTFAFSCFNEEKAEVAQNSSIVALEGGTWGFTGKIDITSPNKVPALTDCLVRGSRSTGTPAVEEEITSAVIPIH